MKNQKKFTSRSNKLKKQGTNSQTISTCHVRYSLTGISTDILFSSLVSFGFCLVAVFFACLFAFKLKIYILLHIRQCRRVNDKNFFTQPISGHKIAFFQPKYAWIIGPTSINIRRLDFHFQPNFNVETTLIHHFEST